VVLDNDEIEVASDALWFVKARGLADDAQELVWDRLQPLRTGDYGGFAGAELTPDESAAVARALRFCRDQVALDEDELRLLGRLTGSDTAPADS